ncbi:hypothetical protein BJX70DRAFT_393722 [Aspergillus crustosus]
MASSINIGLPQPMPTRGIYAFRRPMTFSSAPGTLLPPDSSGVIKIDDLVQYQAVNSEKVKSVHGVDTLSPGNQGAWDWRGKGWLMIASSHWECLGFGHTDDDNHWIVTYFAKTLFTPAGIDIYSRSKGGLPESSIQEILKTLEGFGVEEITTLANSIFQIPHY